MVNGKKYNKMTNLKNLNLKFRLFKIFKSNQGSNFGD